MKLLVTDTNYNQTNIKYLFLTLDETVKKLGGNLSTHFLEQRSELVLNVDKTTLKFLRPTLEDKIADIIAVNYKYNYFKKVVRTAGLNPLEYELLLNALISADIDDDKRYIKSKIKDSESYVIDGVFNFTLKALKGKWAEVVGYIPTIFTREQLRDFVSYLIKDKCGKRVFVDGGKVYDRHFNRLNRSMLTANDGEAEVLKEILLSSSGEVELASKLPDRDEFYLKEFFGDKIFFQKSYFT